MASSDTTSAARDPLAFLAGGGEMGERTRAFDWSKTPVGPIADWPQSLKTAVRIMLNSRYPMFVWWGRRLTKFYNDGYIPMLGKRHPDALGRSAAEVWSDVWPVVGPQTETVLNEGRATWNEELLLVMERNRFTEEAYFTFSYSPVPDDEGGVAGVFCAVTEDTQRVLSQRRLRTLRSLAEQAAQAKTAERACEVAAATVAENPHDLPFVLLYLLDGDGRRAKLAGLAGLSRNMPTSPVAVELGSGKAPWPFRQVVEAGNAVEVHDLPMRFGPLPGGAWPESPQRAIVLPMAKPGQTQLAGFVVAGVSPRLAFNDDYKGFMDLLASHVANAVANARAYEEERRRAEALAELDRAKTTFFSNVSHEFRTPLTLMLGPTEDLLRMRHGVLPREAHEQVAVVHRNALRLQKLVNTLLDFSRIEAGRIQACYEPTDLAALTADLASVFHSAVEKAGMRLLVDCPPLPEPVYVDRDMWEKVVLNLVSNAFKFTLEGEIEVKLSDTGEAVRLTVRDTGAGIAEEQLAHLFERFYRVEGTRARTHEGTGIGLALVQELVKLHCGTVRVESVPGKGSTFSVAVPKGKEHLPADRIGLCRTLASTTLTASHYLEEALRWLPGKPTSPRQDSPCLQPSPSDTGNAQRRQQKDERPRIIWADDNADMRDYVCRLLSDRYDVEAVADGETALAAVRRDLPALVLADIMMPRLDGFGLLRALRDDESTRTLPVILLSARAGEESRVKGLEAGADDYLTKPFSAKELLAHVGSHLELARLRREAADALREADRRKDEFLAMLGHELRNPLAPIRNALSVIQMQGPDPREIVRQAWAVIERQVEYLLRLVDDLLDISRITRGKIKLQKEPVDVATVVGRAVESSRPLIESRKHTLEVIIPDEPLRVEADLTRMAQVLLNLLNNSAKYTPEGGHISLLVEKRSGEVVIHVRDNGMGIPPDVLPKVFDLFTQAERTLDRAEGGLGIGLTLVRRLTEMHGGTVSANSDGPGRGSEFIVRLPLLPESSVPTPSQPTHEAPRGAKPSQSHRILIVDDNKDGADSLATLLRLFGNNVQIAHDGRQALYAAGSYLPDVILLDIGLPGMDGFEVARCLRADQRYGRPLLVALTGYGSEEDRRRAEEAGFDRHMVKPVDFDALEKLLAGLQAMTA